MNVWGVAMVKDEADVIERTIRHVFAQGVQGIIVADNESTDGTSDILFDLQREFGEDVLTLVLDDEVGYWQAIKMTTLAHKAHKYGAEWVWPFDADEVWQHDLGINTVAEKADGSWAQYIEAPLYHHLVTSLDEPGHPFDVMHYRTEAAPIPKVIVRWQEGCTLHPGNHGVTYPTAAVADTGTGIEVRHFPYRSEEQFIRKAINGSRAYAATDLPWGIGQHWREYGLLYEKGGEAALAAAYQAHFVHDLPSASGLVYSPVETTPR